MSILKMTALEVGQKIRNKELSVYEATQAVQKQIAAVDETIHSYITVAECQAQAERIQQQIENGELTGPLAGVPVAIKDNICVEQLPTTCGSKMLENFIPPYTATAAAKLVAAGAVIVGKTNMDEFGMGNTTETSAYGVTRNPWNYDHVPGGSSGGSCTAVAAGECFYALGSDTGGSIRQPSAFCGVTGLKPTYGRVSRYGLVAYASSLEQIGPITRDVADCAAVLETITGGDAKDGTSQQQQDTGFTKRLTAGVKGLRIGIPSDYLGPDTDEQVAAAVMAAAEQLQAQGAIIETFTLGLSSYAVPAYYVIASAEASSNLARFDGIRYGQRAMQYQDLQELYQKSRTEGFGTEVKKRIMLGSYVLGAKQYDTYYQQALHTKQLIKQKFARAFERYDVLLTPVAPTLAPRFGADGGDALKRYMGDVHTVAANLAGLPALSLPYQNSGCGLPMAVQLMGAPYQEQLLFQVGHTLEQLRPYQVLDVDQITKR